jgi:DNA-binding CsgD family transcriptional regulator
MRNETPIVTDQRPVTPLDAVRRSVHKSPLAVGLLHLPQRRFLELSDRAKRLLGLEAIDLKQLDVLTRSKEPDDTYRLFALIVEGALDGYRARRVLGTGAGEITSTVCVRVVARSDDHRRLGPLDNSLRRGAPANGGEAVALVSYTDESQRTGSDTTPSGPAAGSLLTSMLDIVHSDDVGRVLEVFESAAASADGNAAVSVRCGGRRAWQETRVLVKYLREQDRFEFTLAPLADPGIAELNRATELERRLRRIADEVEAAGLFQRAARLPDPDRVPGLETLSSRQWEIVTRLLRGERVPRMARAMYLSPSTVRNHLSTIFRKLGVHSQAELIDRLHPPE